MKSKQLDHHHQLIQVTASQLFRLTTFQTTQFTQQPFH